MALRFVDTTSPPIRDAVVDPKRGFILSDVWEKFFARLPFTTGSIPNIMNVISLSNQSASISATAFQNTTIIAGLYRATYNTRISRAAGSSSSLGITIGWTDGGVAQSFSAAAITGNTTADSQSRTVTMRCDGGTDITYATTYSTSGSPGMRYELDLVLEKIRERAS